MTVITSAAAGDNDNRIDAARLGLFGSGVGEAILQVLFAGMLSSAFFLKSWLRQFRAGLTSNSKDKPVS